MPTCQPRFSEASELCRFSVVESGPMMTDNCQLRPIRKYSKYRVGYKKTNLLSILACRSCNNVGSTLYSVSVSPVLKICFGPPTAESKNLKNHVNFDVGDLFFRSPALWSSQNVFGPPTAGCVVVDFKDRDNLSKD